MSLTLTSSFEPSGSIPTRHTCQGADVSPPLAWAGVPSHAKSLALIIDDPDAPDPAAPQMVWVHWVLYNIPPSASSLQENAGSAGGATLPQGARRGVNDFQHAQYNGPCPPVGRHRYFVKLYALDTVLPDLGKPDKAALETAMKGHVLAHGELVGTYQKH